MSSDKKADWDFRTQFGKTLRKAAGALGLAKEFKNTEIAYHQEVTDAEKNSKPATYETDDSTAVTHDLRTPGQIEKDKKRARFIEQSGQPSGFSHIEPTKNDALEQSTGDPAKKDFTSSARIRNHKKSEVNEKLVKRALGETVEYVPEHD